VSKPPATPPSSDFDGVDEDQVRNTRAATESGQDSGDLEKARRDSAGKPVERHEDEESRDDRSR